MQSCSQWDQLGYAWQISFLGAQRVITQGYSRAYTDSTGRTHYLMLHYVKTVKIATKHFSPDIPLWMNSLYITGTVLRVSALVTGLVSFVRLLQRKPDTIGV